MLVLVRLFPKGGLNGLCNTLEQGKRNFFWKDVEPLYGIRQEGKGYISVLLDVKDMESLQNVFMKNIDTMAAVNKVRTIPVMNPAYFPASGEKTHEMERHIAFLRVEPDKYNQVYSKIKEVPSNGNTSITYLSHSYGDDDVIVSMLTKDRETARKFVDTNLKGIDGVLAFDVSKVVNTVRFVPDDKIKVHKERFMYTKPTGHGGAIKNPDAYAKYIKENAPSAVIVRIFAKNDMESLWKEVQEKVPGFQTPDITPLYASQQEKKEYISMVFETKNFEVLNKFLVDQIPSMKNIRKTRTVPLLEPTYMLLPKEHPQQLERFLVSVQVDPRLLQTVRSKLVCTNPPSNIFMTYMSYSMGQDDILFSVLAENRKSVQAFAKDTLENMNGVVSYDISNQLKTMKLASPERWKEHQNKFLSDYDKTHKGEYDTKYDWTDNIHDYAMLTGAFARDMED